MDEVSAPATDAAPVGDRVHGKVKWFNENKGYGFITPSDGTKDCFVHISAVEKSGLRSLQEGDPVEFSIIARQEGHHSAEDIGRLSKKDDEKPAPDAYLGLVDIDGQVRIVELQPNGEFVFIDGTSNLHNIIYIDARSAALKDAIDELEFLINNEGSEEADIQDFFERHPDLVLTPDYKRLHPHVALESTYETLIPDFLLEPIEQDGLCDLLELKLPSTQTFVLKKSRLRFSAAVLEAAAQLRTYSQFFDDPANRDNFRRHYGLTAYKPRMFVIIGRRGDVDPLQVRAMEGDLPGLRLKTYDQIVERAKARLKRL